MADVHTPEQRSYNLSRRIIRQGMTPLYDGNVQRFKAKRIRERKRVLGRSIEQRPESVDYREGFEKSARNLTKIKSC